MSAIADAIPVTSGPGGPSGEGRLSSNGRPSSNVEGLPAWPLAMLFAPYLVWWALGLIDVILFPMAFIMAVYLLRARGVRVPRGYAVWLVFVLCAALSVTQLGGGANTLIGFTYRFLIYLCSTFVFVYAYNARSRLSVQYLCGLITIVWLSTVFGGFLGMAFPNFLLKTPTSFLLQELVNLKLMARSIVANDLVSHMVVRRFTQGNPDSYFQFAPRPSAPFRYANNWGNVYSILLPIVIAYLLQIKGTVRFWLLLVVLPVSAVPALLTLNRGMLIGVGIAMVYVSVRKAMDRQYAFLIAMVVIGALGGSLYSVLAIQQRNDARLFDAGGSNYTRTSLYTQAIDGARERPLLGYGAPQQGNDPSAPDVGTQGQVWMILVSHGPLALATSMGWLLLATWQSRRRLDAIGLACHTSLLVSIVELLYYGVLPYGLPLMMIAAAVALRPAADADADVRPRVLTA